MAAPEKYDFAGWATKNDIKCGDGRTIRKGAFKYPKLTKVPLVYNHDHKDINAVLGHAWLEERDEGIYAYGVFNDTASGQAAKKSVLNGDLTSLSIYANNLSHEGRDVVHGAIREVSLVVAGANPGAFIESTLSHGFPIEDYDEEAIIHSGEELELYHVETKVEEKMEEKRSEKTVGDIYNTLNEEQKEAVAIIVGQALADASEEDDNEEEEEKEMKHHVFEGENNTSEKRYLTHSDMLAILEDGKKRGSLRDAIRDFVAENEGVLMHSIDTTGMEVPSTTTAAQKYGFRDPNMLFPDAKSLNNPPDWISRNMDWVTKVMNEVHHTPFSRIKSVFADITEDEARARGYIKGNQKKTEVFTLLKRTTTPQTIYKYQKMDRDDVIDITDFDVVAWIRAEMRMMLDEEIARAILIGDGRLTDDESHIKEEHIRPIATDVSLFNIKKEVAPGADEAETANNTIKAVLRARKEYKGSGNPVFWTTEDVLTEMLLLEDKIGHRLYKTEQELATALRVSSIVTVEVMNGVKIDEKELIGVIVNLKDYNVGADRGGQVTNFDDFDIEYNKYQYLIETRMSGALIKPYSAITLVKGSGAAASSQSRANTSMM